MIIYNLKIAILLIAFNRSNIKQVFDRIKVVKPRRLYIAVDGSTNDTQRKISKETTFIVSHIDWECQVFKLYQEKIKDTTNTVLIRFLGSSSKSQKESF